MALNYAPLDLRGQVVEDILEQIFFANKTVSDGYVTFNSDIKAGTLFTEAGMTVAAQLYTGLPLNDQGNITLNDRTITPIKLEYKQEFLQESLRFSRFNKTMGAGAFNIESSEYGSLVANMVGPAISADAETQFWSGITQATKTAIAALTPGNGQGSMTAATQTAVVAMPAGPIDGVYARVLFDLALLGRYIKVAAINITAGNIAGEYAKTYSIIPAQNIQDSTSDVAIYAPRSHKQLMRIANNSVGATQQINFLFDSPANDSKCYYNGIEVLFVPFPENRMYAQRKSAVSWNTDMVDDINKFEIGKKVNDGDVQFVRSIYTLAANVGQASLGVLYGG